MLRTSEWINYGLGSHLQPETLDPEQSFISYLYSKSQPSNPLLQSRLGTQHLQISYRVNNTLLYHLTFPIYDNYGPFAGPHSPCHFTSSPNNIPMVTIYSNALSETLVIIMLDN